ncbi:MAG: NUMOD1 domain-containing DNA-binding protein [Paludibacter sp.]|nr:NUMOD1 domain-containing DNA-binding protein [Paludibacter sp.]
MRKDYEKRKNIFINWLREDGRYELLSEFSGYYGKSEFKCRTCGNVFYSNVGAIKNGKICPNCRNLHLEKSKPMIETNPTLAGFLKNIQDAYCYPEKSQKKLDWVCDKCGSEFSKIPSAFKDGIFKCKYCGDGISFPNKVVFSLLTQVGIDFVPEKVFEWSKFGKHNRFIYDFYIPSKNIIIEVMGRQHYPFSGFFYKKTYGEIHDSDIKKKNLAIQQNISSYIEVDAKYSEFNYIKSSIIYVLGDVLDFSNVNWDEVFSGSLKSRVVEVCAYYNLHKDLSVCEIAETFNIARNDVTAYLRRGAQLGMCNYSINDTKERCLLFKKKKLNVKNEEKMKIIFDAYSKGMLVSEIVKEFGYDINFVYRSLILGNENGKIKYKTSDNVRRINFRKKEYNLNKVKEHILNNPSDSIPKISKLLNVSETTIYNNIKELPFYDYHLVKCCSGKTNSKKLEKPVSKYNKLGEFIEEFESIADAAKCEDITPGAIHGCLSGKNKMCAGYIWKRSEDGLPTRDEIELSNHVNVDRWKPVIQYKIDGDFVREYPSVSEAKRVSGVNCISECLSGRKKTSGGYIWRYKDVKYLQSIEDYVNSSAIKKLKSNKKKNIEQYSKSGTFIQSFSSISDAKRETGVNNISCCALGKANTAGGYIWKYKEGE